MRARDITLSLAIMLAGVTGIQAAQVMISVGSEPPDLRARRGKQAQLRAHRFSRTDDHHRTGLQIEEHRQETHAKLSSPTSGLTGIIFYICLI